MSRAQLLHILVSEDLAIQLNIHLQRLYEKQ